MEDFFPLFFTPSPLRIRSLEVRPPFYNPCELDPSVCIFLYDLTAPRRSSGEKTFQPLELPPSSGSGKKILPLAKILRFSRQYCVILPSYPYQASERPTDYRFFSLTSQTSGFYGGQAFLRAIPKVFPRNDCCTFAAASTHFSAPFILVGLVGGLFFVFSRQYPFANVHLSGREKYHPLRNTRWAFGVIMWAMLRTAEDRTGIAVSDSLWCSRRTHEGKRHGTSSYRNPSNLQPHHLHTSFTTPPFAKA